MTQQNERINKRVSVIVRDTCDSCPYVYYGQFCLKCKAVNDWREIPVTIKDTKTKVKRPHYIPDWCPLEDYDDRL